MTFHFSSPRSVFPLLVALSLSLHEDSFFLPPRFELTPPGSRYPFYLFELVSPPPNSSFSPPPPDSQRLYSLLSSTSDRALFAFESPPRLPFSPSDPPITPPFEHLSYFDPCTTFPSPPFSLFTSSLISQNCGVPTSPVPPSPEPFFFSDTSFSDWTRRAFTLLGLPRYAGGS